MTVTGFDTFCILDWSGGNDRGAGPKPDAIWSALVRHGRAEAPRYHRNRQGAETWMADLVEAELTAGRRLAVGLDFAFGLPRGAAAAICGRADPLRLWAWLAARIEDAPTANNRFDVAAAINRSLPGIGPFWGNGLKRDIPDLPRKGRARSGHGLPERRAVEARLPGAFPVWQLAGAGAVGSQMLMGLPVLERMRVQFPGRVAVWPFEPPDRPVALLEIWPSLFAGPPPKGMIKDAHQVAAVAGALSALSPPALAEMLAVEAPEEGWILGAGHAARLAALAASATRAR